MLNKYEEEITEYVPTKNFNLNKGKVPGKSLLSKSRKNHNKKVNFRETVEKFNIDNGEKVKDKISDK